MLLQQKRLPANGSNPRVRPVSFRRAFFGRKSQLLLAVYGNGIGLRRNANQPTKLQPLMVGDDGARQLS
jgi:hypothetical protein